MAVHMVLVLYMYISNIRDIMGRISDVFVYPTDTPPKSILVCSVIQAVSVVCLVSMLVTILVSVGMGNTGQTCNIQTCLVESPYIGKMPNTPVVSMLALMLVRVLQCVRQTDTLHTRADLFILPIYKGEYTYLRMCSTCYVISYVSKRASCLCVLVYNALHTCTLHTRVLCGLPRGLVTVC